MKSAARGAVCANNGASFVRVPELTTDCLVLAALHYALVFPPYSRSFSLIFIGFSSAQAPSPTVLELLLEHDGPSHPRPSQNGTSSLTCSTRRNGRRPTKPIRKRDAAAPRHQARE